MVDRETPWATQIIVPMGAISMGVIVGLMYMLDKENLLRVRSTIKVMVEKLDKQTLHKVRNTIKAMAEKMEMVNLRRVQSTIRVMVDKMGTPQDMPQPQGEVFLDSTGRQRLSQPVVLVGVSMAGGGMLATVWPRLMRERVRIAEVKRIVRVLGEMRDIHLEEKTLGMEQTAD